MRRRSRTPVALIALLTLLVSTTETLWASVCAPEMPGAAAAAEAHAPAAHAEPGCAGEAAGSGAERPASEHGGSAPEQPHCPLLALGSAGACVPASLPSRTAAQAELPGERAALAASLDSAPDLLFSAPPFHPPKA
ncbi:MAG: hypothetical protein KY467_12235 [Gemmatimonadetes bacterium]|nr:hypothetical protein [Gemmatimonadota bacterium]